MLRLVWTTQEQGIIPMYIPYTYHPHNSLPLTFCYEWLIIHTVYRRFHLLEKSNTLEGIANSALYWTWESLVKYQPTTYPSIPDRGSIGKGSDIYTNSPSLRRGTCKVLAPGYELRSIFTNSPVYNISSTGVLYPPLVLWVRTLYIPQLMDSGHWPQINNGFIYKFLLQLKTCKGYTK